jgi:hypothetical protein
MARAARWFSSGGSVGGAPQTVENACPLRHFRGGFDYDKVRMKLIALVQEVVEATGVGFRLRGNEPDVRTNAALRDVAVGDDRDPVWQ